VAVSTVSEHLRVNPILCDAYGQCSESPAGARPASGATRSPSTVRAPGGEGQRIRRRRATRPGWRIRSSALASDEGRFRLPVKSLTIRRRRICRP